jgi:hypothetical protein
MRSPVRVPTFIIIGALGLSALVACNQKKTLVPFVFPLTPTSVVTGKTVIFYSSADVAGTPVRIAFEISKDNGRTYVPCTPGPGQEANPIVIAVPSGAPNEFLWDSFADIGPGVFTKCIIRATGLSQSSTGRQATTLPFVSNQSGSFTPTASPQGAARSNVFAAPLPDGSVYIAGGLQGNQPTALAEVYDPVGEQVLPVSALTDARTNIAGALLTSGRVLTAGGADVTSGAVATAEIFSKLQNVATAVPKGLNVARFDAALAPLPSGFAVVAGGVGSGGALVPTVELYDPNAGSAGAFASVATTSLAAVRLPTATALADGRVLFAGGADVNGNAVATTFLFDPVALTVTQGPNLAQPRVAHRATRLVSGKVLLAGGLAKLGTMSSAMSSAEIFDPARNSLTLAASMTRARAFFGQDLAGGKVVAVAGSGFAADVTQTGEVYDPDANTWLVLPFTPVSARTEATLVTSGPGRALVVGGGAAAEIYHPLDALTTFVPSLTNTVPAPGSPPVTLPPPPPPPPPNVNPTTLPPPLIPAQLPVVQEAWIAIRSPARARAYHQAVRISTGDVLLVGGTSGVASATASVELFQVSNLSGPQDTVTTRASLLTARAHHAAAILPSGSIAVTGGLDAEGKVLGSIELYNFFLDQWTPATATLAHPRFDHHAILLSTGDVLIVGGRDATGAPVGQAELFHTTSDTIETDATEVTPRADDDVLPMPSGDLLVAGGSDANGKSVLPTEVYDPVARTFTQAGSLGAGRTGLALAPSFNFLQYLVTGGDTNGVTRTDFEALDVSTNSPSGVPGGPQPLDSPRAFHRATPYLTDRAVLLTGGEGQGLTLDTSSLYLPLPNLISYPGAFQASVRATLTRRMNMPRIGFTATPLEDGRVLVAGGFDQRGVAIPGLEVFFR